MTIINIDHPMRTRPEPQTVAATTVDVVCWETPGAPAVKPRTQRQINASLAARHDKLVALAEKNALATFGKPRL